jgi:hypothetical protein
MVHPSQRPGDPLGVGCGPTGASSWRQCNRPRGPILPRLETDGRRVSRGFAAERFWRAWHRCAGRRLHGSRAVCRGSVMFPGDRQGYRGSALRRDGAAGAARPSLDPCTQLNSAGYFCTLRDFGPGGVEVTAVYREGGCPGGTDGGSSKLHPSPEAHRIEGAPRRASVASPPIAPSAGALHAEVGNSNTQLLYQPVTPHPPTRVRLGP